MAEKAFLNSRHKWDCLQYEYKVREQEDALLRAVDAGTPPCWMIWDWSADYWEFLPTEDFKDRHPNEPDMKERLNNLGFSSRGYGTFIDKSDGAIYLYITGDAK